MSAPMKTALDKIKPRNNNRTKATASQIDQVSSMPSREPARTSGRKLKVETQIGIRGDAAVLQRFVDFAANAGKTYVEALDELMIRAGV